MAEVRTENMIKEELIRQIPDNVHVSTSKSLVEFSREDLLRLVACIKRHCGAAPAQEEAS